MIQKTIELALSITLCVTSIAVALATGSFMTMGYGYFTQQSYGSGKNLIVALGMTLVSSLLLIGNIKLARPWISLKQEGAAERKEEATNEVQVGNTLQAKKGSTSTN